MKSRMAFIIISVLILIVQAAIDNFINMSVYVDLALFLFILLMLPYRTSTIVSMIAAFVLGLCVDFLGNSILGMTAAALTVAALFRRGILKITVPTDIMEKEVIPSPAVLGSRRFLTYTAPMVFIYSLAFIIIDCSGFSPFWHNLLRLGITFALNTLIMLFLFNVCGDRRR